MRSQNGVRLEQLGTLQVPVAKLLTAQSVFLENTPGVRLEQLGTLQVPVAKLLTAQSVFLENTPGPPQEKKEGWRVDR